MNGEAVALALKAKTRMGGAVYFHSFLIRALGGYGQLLAPAALPAGKGVGEGWVGPRAGMDIMQVACVDSLKAACTRTQSFVCRIDEAVHCMFRLPYFITRWNSKNCLVLDQSILCDNRY
jgi:hypothetical protein